MHRRQVFTAPLALSLLLAPRLAQATQAFQFPSIDGGEYRMAAWSGQPVLVVNTASLCGFTPQYEGLQALHDTYGPRGLIVLAVPSDDFSQELATEEEVVDFCAVNFNLTLRMTTITPVRGPEAHPFYAWLRDSTGFVPRWNFNKVLLDGTGRVVATFGANADPMGPRMRREIEALLPA